MTLLLHSDPLVTPGAIDGVSVPHQILLAITC